MSFSSNFAMDHYLDEESGIASFSCYSEKSLTKPMLICVMCSRRVGEDPSKVIK